MAEPEARSEVQFDPLVELAKNTFLTRRLRRELFDADLFGEPAWDILLLLYPASPSSGLQLAELAEELRAPVSIIKRWLAVLESRGLVEEDGDAVVLSVKGRKNLRQYLKSQAVSLAEALTAWGKASRH